MFGRGRRCVLGMSPVLLFITSVVFMRAESSVSAPDSTVAMEKYRTAESFLSQKLWIWQKRLKLQDWNLVVKMVRTSELKPKTLGNIHWDAETKTATIKVLDIADYKLAFNDGLRDMEFTIVHELVHLQLSSLPRNEASRSAEEKAVNTLTDALLNLDRRAERAVLTTPAPATESPAPSSR